MNRQAMPHSNNTNEILISEKSMRTSAPSPKLLPGSAITKTPLDPLCTHHSPSTGSRSMKSPIKKKMSVAFSPTSRCLIIPSHHDMTEAERAATWISPEETKANQEDTIKTIRAANQLAQANVSITHNDEVICLRGLENVICGTKQRKLIQKQRDDLVRNVLLVQDRNWQMGYDNADPNMLQAISETFSEDHVAWAIMLGASDAAYVRRRICCQE